MHSYVSRVTAKLSKFALLKCFLGVRQLHAFVPTRLLQIKCETVKRPSQGERVREHLLVSSSLGKWLQYKLAS